MTEYQPPAVWTDELPHRIVMHEHAIWCRMCGDDHMGGRKPARCGRATCERTEDHASTGVCLWCVQHGTTYLEARAQAYHDNRCALSRVAGDRIGDHNVIEVYLEHEDGSSGWAHTVDDGRTWIPREQPILVHTWTAP